MHALMALAAAVAVWGAAMSTIVALPRPYVDSLHRQKRALSSMSTATRESSEHGLELFTLGDFRERISKRNLEDYNNFKNLPYFFEIDLQNEQKYILSKRNEYLSNEKRQQELQDDINFQMTSNKMFDISTSYQPISKMKNFKIVQISEIVKPPYDVTQNKALGLLVDPASILLGTLNKVNSFRDMKKLDTVRKFNLWKDKSYGLPLLGYPSVPNEPREKESYRYLSLYNNVEHITPYGKISDKNYVEDEEKDKLSFTFTDETEHTVVKRSPLELGLVHGLSSNHQVTHHGTNSHTSSHHNVVIHPPKSPASSGTSTAAITPHHHVIHISSLHDVEGLETHAVIDPGLHITSTTVITHDKPLTATVAHPVVAASVGHPVIAAASSHSVVTSAAHTLVAADHPVIEHHEVTVIPVVVKHDVVAIDHPIEKATLVLHSHPVTSTHDLFRSHIGGFGVGLDFGGHGAGHGFYASTGFGLR